ncbi:hypothetical protein FHT15_002580 [Xanthomonas campestris]|nr:hypothetical protein [Xanthomonas euroxanthea]
MENHALKNVIAKKLWTRRKSAPLLARLIEEHGWSERWAYPRWLAWCARRHVISAVPTGTMGGIAVFSKLAERFPERGFVKLFHLIRRRRHVWSHKGVWRVYCPMKLINVAA